MSDERHMMMSNGNNNNNNNNSNHSDYSNNANDNTMDSPLDGHMMMQNGHLNGNGSHGHTDDSGEITPCSTPGPGQTQAHSPTDISLTTISMQNNMMDEASASVTPTSTSISTSTSGHVSGSVMHMQSMQTPTSGSWRAYYEHPLTAATSAMLNISGGGGGGDDQNGTMNLIYDYYKIQTLADGKASDIKLGDYWSNGQSSNNNNLLASTSSKSANVLSAGGGASTANELLAQPTSSPISSSCTTSSANNALSTNAQHIISSQDLQNLFVTTAQSYGAPVSTHAVHAAVQAQAQAVAQAVAQAQQQQLEQEFAGHELEISVKREPEDLSSHHGNHERKSESPITLQLTASEAEAAAVSGGIIISGGLKSRHKVLLLSQNSDLVVDVNNHAIKDELQLRPLASPQHGSPRAINCTPNSTHSLLEQSGQTSGPLELIADLRSNNTMYTTAQMFPSSANGDNSSTPSPIPYTEHLSQYPGGAIYAAAGMSGSIMRPGSSAGFSDPYYREYFTTITSTPSTPEPVYSSSGQRGGHNSHLTYIQDGSGSSSDNGASLSANGVSLSGGGSVGVTASFVERYVRQSSGYHTKGVIAAATAAGLTVDLPSPDSGIGADAITPRDQSTMQQSFDYTDLCQTNPNLLDATCLSSSQRSSSSSSNCVTSRSRPWHDFGRQSDADKIQIPKMFSPYGFKYHLETPISTSQRREDDRITYINKGQFYGITLEYVPDPDKQLKGNTVKSIVMLMFREEKSPEDEIKAWQFWHGRQHSVKQRILDADTKNSVGLAGCIEEVAHNAIAIYWNPLESSAKISVAVQCLSTDFSSQKGVKGLPLHLQIDTYEDPRDPNVSHRGYCQIKVFCDKGAERKTRDEERRAAKRKLTATGRKKLDELYHPVCERSEFYAMSDLSKPPVLFTPAEDIDKLTSMELQGFYGHDTDSLGASGGEGSQNSMKSGSPFLLHAVSKPSAATPILKFHNHFPPDAAPLTIEKKEPIDDNNANVAAFQPPLSKRAKLYPSFVTSSIIPPLSERVMLYVRQEPEDVFTPLHVCPPNTDGLLNAIESKYKISASSISNLYRKNKKGITVRIDDEMISYYCNEDVFLLEVKPSPVDEQLYDLTFIELASKLCQDL